jgi:hypothetical protein
MSADATILTDDLTNRSRPYNLGEREVAAYLNTHDYKEHPVNSGIWHPAK